MKKRPKKWIAGALRKHRKGHLHKVLGVRVGTKIPLRLLEQASKKPGRIGREARLARTLRRLGKR